MAKPQSGNRLRKKTIVLYGLGSDFIASVLAWVAFYFYKRYLTPDFSGGVSFYLTGSLVFIGLFWLGIYGFLGAYNGIFKKSRLKESVNLLKLVLAGILVLTFFLMLDEGNNSSYNYFNNILIYFIIHFAFGIVAKLWYLTYVKQLIKQQRIWFNTLLVGSSDNAYRVYADIRENNAHLGLLFRGFVTVSTTDRFDLSGSLPNLGTYTELQQVIKDKKIEQVILATENEEHKTIEAILNLLEDFEGDIKIIPDIYQILLGSVKVNHIFGTALIEINRELMSPYQASIKRAIDVGVALFVLIFFSPLYIAVAIITKLTSKGPIFYMQERIGKGGKPFKIIKYRSMFVDAEKMGPKLAGDFDPRITKWGRFMRKTRLDEIPQFLNVLKGEMSLVGPRPERQFFIDQILPLAPHYKHLHRVKPGITSLGQVKFGYANSVDEMIKRLKYDIIYIENMSIAMDFRILFYTVLTVIQGRGK